MIGIGLVGMVIAVLLRQYKPEYAVFVSLAVGVCSNWDAVFTAASGF